MPRKAPKVLQRLLWSDEYNELEDVVIAEGEFIEIDAEHNPLRQVILGMTPCNLIVAERHIANYKDDPEVYFLTDVDLELDGLEISSVWPICLLRMDNSYFRYELIIRVYNQTRYYELTNTHLNGNLEKTWRLWLERVLYLREDPYGYIRAQYDEYNIPYPDYYVMHEKSRDMPAADDLIWKLLDLDAVEMLEKDIAMSEANKKNKKKKKGKKKSDSKERTKKSKKKKWFKKDKNM
ncbi:uncharacterized protein LOC123537262 [Mercenaria mercenaria]|uniref:uncharacterized protein LOC123537262 n=1 Tax=Mercenaria mercenaria TaxID=6596 RepID=UPI00234F7C49|nr:uncharacterized protein LOC123537262 [Mercenaria mercenaria]